MGNALLGLECQGPINQEQQHNLDNYFKRFGIEHLKQAWPAHMSSGQRQRIALIQSLACKPDILFLDEPFSSLDYQMKLTLQKELMTELRASDSKPAKTAVLVTHDIEEAITLGDTIMVLGGTPATITDEIAVNFSEAERDPVKARSSSAMGVLFKNVWEALANATK